MVRLLFCIAIILATTLEANSQTSEVPVLISSLGGDEKLEVEYLTQGCFHRDDQIVTFFADRVSVQNVGEAPLGPQKILQLDKYMQTVFDRGGEGGCTTHTRMEFRHFRGAQELASYQLNDNSCVGAVTPGTFDISSIIYEMSPTPRQSEKSENSDETSVD